MRPVGVSVVNPTSFGEDRSGRLYVASLDGPVYRLVPQMRARAPILALLATAALALCAAATSDRSGGDGPAGSG